MLVIAAICSLVTSIYSASRLRLLIKNFTINKQNYEERRGILVINTICCVIMLFVYGILDPYGFYAKGSMKFTTILGNYTLAFFIMIQARSFTWIWINIISNGLLQTQQLQKIKKMFSRFVTVLPFIYFPPIVITLLWEGYWRIVEIIICLQVLIFLQLFLVPALVRKIYILRVIFRSLFLC